MCILPFFPVKHNSKISSINIQVRDYLVVIQYVTVLFFKQILSKLYLTFCIVCKMFQKFVFIMKHVYSVQL